MDHKFNFLKKLRIAEIDTYELNDPMRTLHHREIILSKPFLRKLYTEWYSLFKDECQDLKHELIIELGSGGGFIKEIIPEAMTSDLLELPSNDLKFDSLDMPFDNHSVGAFLMINVFHHLPDSEKFLKEAERTLIAGGKIVMIEPWNSLWGRIVYQNFHHETFDPKGDWKIHSSGPLTDANGALPWIVFKRDIQSFYKKFPDLIIRKVHPHTPLRYLLSGGVSLKSLVPARSFKLITAIEKLLSPLASFFSMFVVIIIEKKDNTFVKQDF